MYCLFYTLVELRTGELPWQEYEADQAATFELKVAHLRCQPPHKHSFQNKIIPVRWLGSVEPQYLSMLEHLTSLRHNIEPSYAVLRKGFAQLLADLKLTPSSPFDWEKGSKSFAAFDKAELSRIFRADIK